MERLQIEFIEDLIGCKSANCVCTARAERRTQRTTCASTHTVHTNKVWVTRSQSPHLSHTLAMITMHAHTRWDGREPRRRVGQDRGGVNVKSSH